MQPKDPQIFAELLSWGKCKVSSFKFTLRKITALKNTKMVYMKTGMSQYKFVNRLIFGSHSFKLNGERN